MDNKRLFEKYYSRIVADGILKSLICGFILGFPASFIVALVMLFFTMNGVWLAIAIGLGVVALTTPVFYFLKFRASAKKVAERIDRLGLEERLITMMELQKDESYIAMRQREDANENLRKVNRSLIRLTVSRALIITVAIMGVLSISMITLTAFADDLPIVPIDEVPKYTVTYTAEEGGYIKGEIEQIILSGESSTVVVPVAEDGYRFDCWSDGRATVERIESDVQKNIAIIAVFVEIDDNGIAETESVSMGTDDGESDEDSDSQSGEAAPDQGKGDPDAPPAPGIGGEYIEGNQIINNATYYRDLLGDSYDAVISFLADGGGNLSAEEKALVLLYFQIIV